MDRNTSTANPKSSSSIYNIDKDKKYSSLSSSTSNLQSSKEQMPNEFF
jgi:hypothetical protein